MAWWSCNQLHLWLSLNIWNKCTCVRQEPYACQISETEETLWTLWKTRFDVVCFIRKSTQIPPRIFARKSKSLLYFCRHLKFTKHIISLIDLMSVLFRVYIFRSVVCPPKCYNKAQRRSFFYFEVCEMGFYVVMRMLQCKVALFYQHIYNISYLTSSNYKTNIVLLHQ